MEGFNISLISILWQIGTYCYRIFFGFVSLKPWLPFLMAINQLCKWIKLLMLYLEIPLLQVLWIISKLRDFLVMSCGLWLYHWAKLTYVLGLVVARKFSRPMAYQNMRDLVLITLLEKI
jgi:hypothetical protein